MGPGTSQRVACFLETERECDLDPNSILTVWDRHESARYIWITVRGARLTLCEKCCAQWRMTHGPELTPVRITLIGQEEGNGREELDGD